VSKVSPNLTPNTRSILLKQNLLNYTPLTASYPLAPATSPLVESPLAETSITTIKNSKAHTQTTTTSIKQKISQLNNNNQTCSIQIMTPQSATTKQMHSSSSTRVQSPLLINNHPLLTPDNTPIRQLQMIKKCSPMTTYRNQTPSPASHYIHLLKSHVSNASIVDFSNAPPKPPRRCSLKAPQ
jgi:hypothetical protein